MKALKRKMLGICAEYAHKLKQPWVISVLFVAFIPFFPEYFAPIFAAGALMAAGSEIRNTGTGFQVGTIGKIMLVYIAYMAFGLLYSPNFLSTLATLGMWIAMFMVYLAMTTVLNTRRRLDSSLLVISLVAGSVGFIGCVQYLLRAAVGLRIPLEFWNFIDNIILDIMPIEIKETPFVLRVSSTFNNANIFSEAMIMLIPIIGYYSFYGRREKHQLICRFCLMTAAGGIAFSYSRGSYLALIAAALVFCAANIKKIVLMVVTLISGLLLVPDSVMARLFTITETDGSINERLNIWHSCVSFMKTNPIFGVGAGISNTWSLLLSRGINAPHMHNLVMQLAVEGGIIAIAIFAVICWKYLSSGVLMLIRNSSGRMIGVMLMAFSLGFLTNSLFDFPLMTPKLVGIFLTVISISDAAARIYLKKQTTALFDIITNKSITGKGERLTYPTINNTK